MSIPQLNTYGLLPPGFHLATMAELKQKFGFSPKRRSLIEEGLELVTRELVSMGVLELYVDGSFVEQDPSPGDLDGYVLTESPSKVYQKIAERQELWLMQYRMDIWPAATDVEGEGSQSYFEQLFSHTADDSPRPKGIVKLKLRG